MNKEINQLTVTSIPETIESDTTRKKDEQYWILESKTEISTTEDLFQSLRQGLRSNCNIQNNSEIDERLKNILINKSPDESRSLKYDVEDPKITQDVSKDNILEILEKSRQLKKENLQKIEDTEILLSGQGGRPFVRVEGKEKQHRNENHKTPVPYQRELIMNKLDELLIKTLKCTAEVERVGEMNSNANIKYNPDSAISQDILEMKSLITDLFINAFSGNQNLTHLE